MPTDMCSCIIYTYVPIYHTDNTPPPQGFLPCIPRGWRSTAQTNRKLLLLLRDPRIPINHRPMTILPLIETTKTTRSRGRWYSGEGIPQNGAPRDLNQALSRPRLRNIPQPALTAKGRESDGVEWLSCTDRQKLTATWTTGFPAQRMHE